MGISLYDKLYNSADIDSLTLNEIVARVEGLVNLALLEMAEWYRIMNCHRQPSESATEYMLALRKLSCSCYFQHDIANTTHSNLLDQFVFSLTNKEIQKYLLQQPQLTVTKVVTIATTFELSVKLQNLLQVLYL